VPRLAGISVNYQLFSGMAHRHKVPENFTHASMWRCRLAGISIDYQSFIGIGMDFAPVFFWKLSNRGTGKCASFPVRELLFLLS